MGGCSLRVTVIWLSVLVFIATLLMNGLAGAGRGPFHSRTGDVSSRYETDITPANWTFSIWGVIYSWLSLMLLYLTSYLCRGWSLSLLPYGFYLCWLANMVLNMTWLFLWDQESMYAALGVLAGICFTNYSAVFFCCYATDYYGLWLRENQPRDLLCLRLLVQNGLCLYATWTTIATLINLTIVLQLVGVDKSTAATVSLCILLVELVGWFLLENFLLDCWVRWILSVHPVVVLALLGIVSKHFDPEHPSPNAIFMVVLLVVSCMLLVARVAMVIKKSRTQPLYSDGSTHQLMSSPLDTTKKRWHVLM